MEDKLIERVLALREKMLLMNDIAEGKEDVQKFNEDDLSYVLTEMNDIRNELKDSELKDEKDLFELIDECINGLSGVVRV